jgi:hypothetical protein
VVHRAGGDAGVWLLENFPTPAKKQRAQKVPPAAGSGVAEISTSSRRWRVNRLISRRRVLASIVRPFDSPRSRLAQGEPA